MLCVNASTISYQLHLGLACGIFLFVRADYRACNYNCVTARQHVSNYDNSTVCHSATQYITLRHKHLRGNGTQYICTHHIDIVYSYTIDYYSNSPGTTYSLALFALVYGSLVGINSYGTAIVWIYLCAVQYVLLLLVLVQLPVQLCGAALLGALTTYYIINQ